MLLYRSHDENTCTHDENTATQLSDLTSFSDKGMNNYRKLGKFCSRFNFVSEYNYENKKHEIFYQMKNNIVRINRAMKIWINGQIHVYVC